MLGVRIVSLRVVLLLFFLMFVLALYAIASRFASPPLAGLATLLGVVWSVPNHFSSMPSWYNLFFATFGTLALLRHIETGRKRWLAVAGFCGALGMLGKMHGVFFLAAGLLFLVYREQVMSPSPSAAVQRGQAAFRIFKAVFLAGFVFFLWRLLASRPGKMEYLHFFIPGAAVSAFLLWSENRRGRAPSAARFRALFDLLLPFFGGAAGALALLLVPYAASGALDDLYRGVLFQSRARLSTPKTGLWLPPRLVSFSSGLPYGVLLALPAAFWQRRASRVLTFAVALLCILLLAVSHEAAVFREVFQAARSLGVLAVLAGCLLLVRDSFSQRLSATERQKLFLMTAVAAMVTIVQFPFAHPVYFCYAAPVVALAILAIVSKQPESPRLLHFTILIFYLLVGVFRANAGYIWSLGPRAERERPDTALELRKAGILVPRVDKAVYESLVALIREKSEGGPIFAGPDCPEVYFLSNLPNQTRALYDFLSPQTSSPLLTRLLAEKQVKLVVINGYPNFSRKIPSSVLSAIQTAYPCSREIGRFSVHWRDARSRSGEKRDRDFP